MKHHSHPEQVEISRYPELVEQLIAVDENLSDMQ
jgi:hypothetical protein